MQYDRLQTVHYIKLTYDIKSEISFVYLLFSSFYLLLFSSCLIMIIKKLETTYSGRNDIKNWMK